MDEVTLKHGRGFMRLRKSDDLIAIRPSSQANVAQVLAHAPADTSEVGTKLDQFQIVKVNDTPAMERTLDDLRDNYLVDAGSHVYHTPNSTAPIVPTGKITVRFTPSSTKEQREQVLAQHKLEIVDQSADEVDGTKVTTYTLRTTPDSLNPLKVVQDLQQSNNVVSLAEADLAVPGALTVFQIPIDPLLKEQWHLRNTGIQFGDTVGLKAGADARVVAAWQRMQSLGSPACVVAVIDDGFDLTHPDLSGNSKVVAPWDFTTSTNNPAPQRFSPDTRRGDYHGTACAGVAIGNANGTGITGAAPDCRFMPVRWTGTISNDTIKKQFEYVDAQGAWVVSCSWGVASDFFELSTVMNEAIAKCARNGRNGLGCVIVFAAGNASHDINDPANGTLDGFAVHPDVIAVAACTSMDQKSNYSNFGREISVCAPSNGVGGVGILTSDVRGTFVSNGSTFASGYDAGDYTRTFGGTSSATPLVAGICALILSVNPSLTAREVKQILESTTRKIGGSYDNNGHSIFFGFGCVNADAAVKKAMESLSPASFRSRVRINNSNGKPRVNDLTLYGSEFWGISRHELIASVATNFLTLRAKSKIAKLLPPGQALTQIAGWADRIKGLKPTAGMDRDTREFLQSFPNDASKKWHYVDLPLGVSSYEEARQLRFTRDDDVVQMIERCVQVLQGRSKFMSQLNALRCLVHLVGDVHQPLHVGCGFIDNTGGRPRLEDDPAIIRQKGLESDKGGNSLVLPVSGSLNLHSYWDSYLGSDEQPVDVTNLSFAANSAEVRRSAEIAINKLWGQLKRAKVGTQLQSAVGVATNVADPSKWATAWANTSLNEARKAYKLLQIKTGLGNGKYEVSWPGKSVYDAECRTIVSNQLATASDNLAALLNAIF
ncbi:MAG: hypothetical protein V7638_2968 [Acidobacteriota bacterium]|jgi:subtilisin family serine protease